MGTHHEHDHGGESCGCGCGCGAGPLLDPELSARWQDAPGDELVCHCGQVDKAAIVGAIEAGSYTLPLVKLMTGACQGSDCEKLNPQGRCCEIDIQALIALYAQPPVGQPLM